MFLELLSKYHPIEMLQVENKRLFIDAYRQYGSSIFYRSSTLAHVTSSAIILNESLDQMLCVFHNIYQTFSWVGGHNDGNEDCLEVALKEAYEETSIPILKFYSKIPYSLDVLPVMNHLKNGKVIPTHLHLNVTFVLIGNDQLPLKIKPDENSDVRWIPIEDLNRFCKEESMVNLYRQIIEKVKLK